MDGLYRVYQANELANPSSAVSEKFDSLYNEDFSVETGAKQLRIQKNTCSVYEMLKC